MAAFSPPLPLPDLPTLRTQLAGQLTALADHWATLSETELREQPGPGRWSRKEILGHLVDSAITNYRRFVLAQLAPPLHPQPYDQEAWVRLTDYQHMSSADLLTLWKSNNCLILHLLERVSEPALATECRSLNGNPLTLHGLIDDYVLHLEHHIRQIIHEHE